VSEDERDLKVLLARMAARSLGAGETPTQWRARLKPLIEVIQADIDAADDPHRGFSVEIRRG